MDINLDRFDSRRSTVYAPNGLVATSQPLAAQVGLSILRDGGNAFDAAVATTAALNVVEPTSTGIGGDVFACYRTSDGEVGALRSCGGAPADATLERVKETIAEREDLDPERVEMPSRGPHTVTVPGTARGWEMTAREFGQKPLEELLQPAIRYALEGYPVSEVIATDWERAEQRFDEEHAREAYLFDDQAPEVGQHVRLPQLGRSLEKIAEQGADIVYEGEIAEQIADEVQSKGGFLTVDDLASFEPELIEPISTTYNGVEVFELPPNNQGSVALEALNIAEALDAGDYPLNSPDRVHYFAEAMKLAFEDGHYYITDPEFEDVPRLASKSYARRRATEVGEQATSDVPIGMPDSGAEDADTVLATVADRAGNVVSYINSRYMRFGSGLVAGDTGIALQNRGASFSLDPNHPNHLEPGKRPFHTLIPGIARMDADDWLAFGVKGGYMQPQGHVQVISNLVDYEQSLQASLDFPRWRYQENGTLAIEERLAGRIGAKLARRGHDVRVIPPGKFGAGQLTRCNSEVLSGATEPRKDGNAVGY